MHLRYNQYRERTSDGIQLPHLSHQEWSTASETTRSVLDHKCREPRNLLFFVGAIYQFTYNSDGNFTHSQLGLLLDLPTCVEINNFHKISIMVAPPGIKMFEFDSNKPREEYEDEGWVKKLVGTSPIRPHSTPNNMRGKRKQYGLKHHVTSTVHASMGDTLNKIVTEISSENNEYSLWDKAQVIVLLRRTKVGKNIIFVGYKTDCKFSVISNSVK